MDILKGSKKIASSIAAFARQGKTRQQKAHQLAVSALNHANEHGDTTLLSRLYHAFGKTENPNEFRYWVRVMSNKAIGWDKETKSFKQRSKGTPVKDGCDIDKAVSTPWWNMDEVNEGRNKAFDPVKDTSSVLSILKRHCSEAEQAGEKELVEHYTKMIVQMENMNKRMKMLKEQQSASLNVKEDKEEEKEFKRKAA